MRSQQRGDPPAPGRSTTPDNRAMNHVGRVRRVEVLKKVLCSTRLDMGCAVTNHQHLVLLAGREQFKQTARVG